MTTLSKREGPRLSQQNQPPQKYYPADPGVRVAGSVRDHGPNSQFPPSVYHSEASEPLPMTHAQKRLWPKPQMTHPAAYFFHRRAFEVGMTCPPPCSASPTQQGHWRLQC